MSVVLNDKPRQSTLKWRWPLSRELTLSVATTAVLLAVWWAVAALQLISPLFLPPPGEVLQKLITIAGPQGFMDATLWQHGGEPDADRYRPVGGSAYWRTGGDRHGAQLDGARDPRPADRTLSSGAAAGLLTADGDLVWHR